MRAHIPGNPIIIPQNSRRQRHQMANYLATIAPQDGTAIGMFPNTLVAAQAVGTDGVQYDVNKFSWLGTMSTSPLTFTTWHTTGVRTIEDARRKELTVAASNKGAITYTFPRMLNEFLGLWLKIVSGYQGNSTMVIAMERGEVDGVTNSWDNWKSLNPAWVAEKKINFLVQTEPRIEGACDPVSAGACAQRGRPQGDGPDRFRRCARQAAGDRQQRAAERVKALRDAFDATLMDQGFIEAATATAIEINPLYGAQVRPRWRRCSRRRKTSPPARADHRRIEDRHAASPAARALAGLTVLFHPCPRRTDLRAPARGLGRRRGQDRAAGQIRRILPAATS
jgi:hypothetical protein